MLRRLKTYSLSNLWWHNTVLTILTRLCIRAPEFIHLITDSCSFWPVSPHFPHSPAPGNHPSTLCFYLFDFFRFQYVLSKSLVKSELEALWQINNAGPLVHAGWTCEPARKGFTSLCKSCREFPQLPALTGNSQSPSAMRTTTPPGHFMTPGAGAEMSKGEATESQADIRIHSHFIQPSKL